MILAVDVGNSTIQLGVIKGARVVMRVRVEYSSSRAQCLKELKLVFASIHAQFSHIESAIVCSVVPKFSGDVCALIKKICGVNAVLVGRDIQVPIKNNYREKELVGQDRLVGAYAASVFYGAPCMIIDFGTAITIDLVSKSGAYEGGIIIPGIRLSAKSLFEHTALLPSLEQMKSPRNLIGKTTEESILSGLFYGYGTMCDGLIRQIRSEHAKNAKVILTGGYTHLIKKFMSSKIDAVDPDLIFKGLLKLL